MSDVASMKPFDIAGEGVVVKASDIDLRVSDKREFDSNAISNGIVDDDKKDGGVSVARNSGQVDSNKVRVDVFGLNGGGKGQYELSGFTVKYNVPDSKDIGSTSVLVSYNSIQEIKWIS